MACAYQNLFGKVGEGVHSIRIANIAVVDVLMTILVAYVVSLFLPFRFSYVLLFLFLAGIVLHRVFCVRTTVDRILSTL